MAMKKPTFEIPAILANIEIPKYVPDSMKASGPFIGKEVHNEPLGFPGELVDGWEEKAVEEMGNMVNKYRGLRVS